MMVLCEYVFDEFGIDVLSRPYVPNLGKHFVGPMCFPAYDGREHTHGGLCLPIHGEADLTPGMRLPNA